MRLFGLTLALCALAFATNIPRNNRIPNSEWLNEIVSSGDRRIEETAFRAQREYRFIYNGQLTTGIPQSSRQHSATRIQAVVSLMFKTDNQVILKMTHVRMAKINRQIPNPRQMLPFEAFEEAQIVKELEEKLLLPVQFKYNHGLISEIAFDGKEMPWSANMKRAVLNMLQVNLKQHGRTDLSEEQLLLNSVQEPITADNDFFTCQERTLEGDCETHYTITSQPTTRWNGRQQVLNVTKTINFEKCRQRPDIRYNMRFAEQCNTCDRKYANEEQNMLSSTVSRFNISGNQEHFLIETAVVESQYIYAPINEQTDVIATYVNQTLELIRAGPIKGRIEEPSNMQMSDSQMVYTPEWDMKKERFFMDGDSEQQFLQWSPYSEIKNKVDFVEQILQRMIRFMADEQQGIEEEAPRQLARLVKTLRMCTAAELHDIHNKFYEKTEKIAQEHQQKVKDILIDAMALAGTKNTIEHLVEKAKSRKAHPIKIAIALKSLTSIRVVSEKQIQMVMDLCKHEVSERSPMLKQSCLLTVGSMINAFCTDNQDRLAIELNTKENSRMCPLSLKQRYVQQLIANFKQAKTQYDQILALKTLGNAGIDVSVFELENIIKNIDGEQQPIVRSVAIFALRQLRSVMPRKIQKILMPVFKNQMELAEIRMAAVAMIMQTQPERSILDQIAQQLTIGRCQQVVSFTYTLLHTLANSTQPCEKRVAEDLQVALRHARTMPLYRMNGLSKYIHKQMYSQKYNMGATLNLASIMTNDSYLPKELMVGLNTAMFGQWQKNMLQFGFIQQNGEQMFEQVLGHQGIVSEKTLEQLLTRGRRALRPTNTNSNSNSNSQSASASSSKSTSASTSNSNSNEQDQRPRTILRDMFKKLNINGRRSRQEQPTAMLYMRYRDQDYAMLPLDAETMPSQVQQMFSSGRFNIGQMESLLSQGFHMSYHFASFVHEFSRKIPTSLGLPLVVSSKMPALASINGQIKAQLTPKDKIRHVQISINARPTMAITKCLKVEAWTPIVNSGLKIVESAQINLPINTVVEMDANKNADDLKLTIRVPKKLTRVLAIRARPVSYVRVWPETLKTYAEPEEVTIQGEEWDRVNTFDRQIGDHTVGVQMRMVGQWQRTPFDALAGTPFGAYAGENHMQVTMQPGTEAPEEIIIKATVDLFEPMQQELKPTMDAFYSQQDNQRFFESNSQSASSSSEEENKEKKMKNKNSRSRSSSSNNENSQRFQKYSQSFRANNPVEHSVSVKVETRGSSINRKCELNLKSQCGELMRFCKWQMELIRSPIPSGRYQESKPWMLTAKGQMLYPQIPYSLKQLEQLGQDDNQECNTQIEAEWGPQGHKEHFVHLKIQASRSEQQKRMQQSNTYNQLNNIQDNMHMFSPVLQYEQLLKAAVLTQYKIQAEYNLNPVLANMTNKLFGLIKNVHYWNADVAQVDVRNPEGRLQAMVSIDPRNLQYVNITVRMPHENVTVIDMALPMPIQPMNIRRSASIVSMDSVISRLTPSNKCQVSSGEVQTFDQVKYRVPLTTCYSVLAKDCSGYGQPKFSILIKKISQSNEGKKMKIVTQEKVIELVARQERYVSEMEQPVIVRVDGRQLEMTDSKMMRKHGIEQQGQYLKVVLPEAGVQVYFDGFAASIKISQLYRNAQCGLCGHFDGEQTDEFRTADNRIVDDVRQFHRSFLHQDEECKIDEQLINDEEQYRRQPLVWDNSASNSGSSSSSSEEDKASSSNEWSSSESESSSTESEERRQWIKNPYARDTKTKQPRQVTKVIEQGHEICFSMKPVPECPTGTFAAKYETERKVSFACLPRSDAEAQSLRRIARNEQIVQTEQMKPSFVETVLVASECQRF